MIMNELDAWYLYVIFFVIIFAVILIAAKDKKKYLRLFCYGCIFGFYFDFFSVLNGYYAYSPYFASIMGIPITVTISEGIAVSITVFFYDLLKKIHIELYCKERRKKKPYYKKQ